MEIIKKVKEEDSENIANKIQDAFAPVYPGVNLVFVEKYHKNETGKLVPEIIGGIVKSPLTLSSQYINQERNVCFEFSGMEAYHKIGNSPFEKKKLRAFIPVDSELVNMDQLIQINENPSITYKPEIPSGDNVVKLYVGASAYNYLNNLIKRK